MPRTGSWTQTPDMDTNTLPVYASHRPGPGTRLPQATVALAVLTFLAALPSIGFGVWMLDDTMSQPGSTDDFASLGYYLAAVFAVPALFSVVVAGSGWWLCRRVPRAAFALTVCGLIVAVVPLVVLLGFLAS